MSNSFVSFGAPSGVISPKWLMRSDLDVYDLGLREARNFTIDYMGAISTRPGLEFTDYIQDGDEPARLVRFQFSSDNINTVGLLFHKNKLRFIQEGGYVLEPAKAIGILAKPITIVGHGFSNGDWIKIDGRTREVSDATADTFQTLDPFGNAADETGTGATEVARIYTVASPYDTADLSDIVFDQFRDEVYITHTGYAHRKLTRSGTTSWAFSLIESTGNSAVPTGLALDSPTDNSFGAYYAVTAVNLEGVESQLASYIFSEDLIDFTSNSGEITFTWDAISDTEFYRVYRSLFQKNAGKALLSQELGYIGKAVGTTFIDNNVLADYTRSPLIQGDPFADGAVSHINITAAGSGYQKNVATVSVTGGGGSGFLGTPIVDGGGEIIGVLISRPGSGYSSPTVTFTDGVGTGATGTATLSSVGGNWPACSRRIQQRRVYGGTTNLPTTVFGSRIDDNDSFAYSGLSADDDPYILTLDDAQFTPIRYIEQSPNGMFIFNEDSLYELRGADDRSITISSAKNAEIENEGCAKLPPLRIGREYVYLQSGGNAVLRLGATNLPTHYTVSDVSRLSEHFFRAGNPIVSWTWAKKPNRLIWAARRDGSFLTCAYIPEQNVMAWSNHTTKGSVEDCEALTENGVDRTYMIVKRKIGSVYKRYIERTALRDHDTVDDMFSVDSGLASGLTYPAADLTLAAYDGTAVVATASTSVFTEADVGKMLRIGNGKAIVTAQTTTSITVEFVRAAEMDFPEYETPPIVPEGSWSLTGKSSTFSGLDHLEGETVEVLGDGGVFGSFTVADGAITLPTAVSYAIIGLPFTGEVKTLPISLANESLESRSKRTAAVALRLHNTRGLELGAEGLHYPLKARSNERYGQPPEFLTGLYDQNITTGYDFDGSVEIKKVGPVAATILGIIRETEIGDT